MRTHPVLYALAPCSKHPSFHLSVHPSTMDVQIPASQPLAGYLPAKPGSVAFVSFSALPDPDKAEPPQQHAASREERNRTKKKKQIQKGSQRADSTRGRKDCDRNVDSERQAMKDKKWYRESRKVTHRMLIYVNILQLLAGRMTAWRVTLTSLWITRSSTAPHCIMTLNIGNCSALKCQYVIKQNEESYTVGARCGL